MPPFLFQGTLTPCGPRLTMDPPVEKHAGAAHFRRLTMEPSPEIQKVRRCNKCGFKMHIWEPGPGCARCERIAGLKTMREIHVRAERGLR